MPVLYISPAPTTEPELVNSFYSNHGNFHEGDSGLDLFCMKEVTVPGNTYGFPIRLGICCQLISHIPHQCNAVCYVERVKKSYFLIPRSSISKTPLRMSNSIGLIDSGYTGELIAMVDNVGDSQYTISPGTRLFQVASPSLKPFTFELVDKLDTTSSRGDGGFGSTDGNNSGSGSGSTLPSNNKMAAENLKVAPMFGVCQ